MKTKERILMTSVDLFNRSGVVAVTTNHIAKAMNISPGNLYFHYDNKEEILEELFRRMAKETYDVWRPRRTKKYTPLGFINENFELYWKYRFFHREMYALRRKDPQLAKMWRDHIQKMMKLMVILYRHWVKDGKMAKIAEVSEMQYIAESLLAMSTTFLQFFESAEKTAGKRSIERGKRHVARLLLPYTAGETKDEFEKFLKS
ncbi:TetR family transcriptional regulator [Bdellovibrio bacteriovorus]|uniref:TetR family transcriptional regulator n=1 Tax=Bdellovibrio bacteriovorus TaxID=959 RepID=A0A150WPT5_BDEBC|nr:TetR/AcrR family transcriptional regulator [Bdellovibrio bacteriovorus]KYG66317.1 TetR family transcriptional regulator [Bdellovibrio bacteriovorus]